MDPPLGHPTARVVSPSRRRSGVPFGRRVGAARWAQPLVCIACTGARARGRARAPPSHPLRQSRAISDGPPGRDVAMTNAMVVYSSKASFPLIARACGARPRTWRESTDKMAPGVSSIFRGSRPRSCHIISELFGPAQFGDLRISELARLRRSFGSFPHSGVSLDSREVGRVVGRPTVRRLAHEVVGREVGRSVGQSVGGGGAQTAGRADGWSESRTVRRSVGPLVARSGSRAGKGRAVGRSIGMAVGQSSGRAVCRAVGRSCHWSGARVLGCSGGRSVMGRSIGRSCGRSSSRAERVFRRKSSSVRKR